MSGDVFLVLLVVICVVGPVLWAVHMVYKYKEIIEREQTILKRQRDFFEEK